MHYGASNCMAPAVYQQDDMISVIDDGRGGERGEGGWNKGTRGDRRMVKTFHVLDDSISI